MIAIVLACEVKAEPPVQVYLEEFERAGVEYRVICWAPRSDSPLHQNPPGCIEFKYKKRDGSLKSRIVNYFRFRRFLIRTLRELNPDKCLFIPTQAGVLLPKRYFIKHAGRYFFDYRDPGYENHRFYLKRVMHIVRCSYATAISSRGFLNVLLPSDKYVISHNVYEYETRRLSKRPLGEHVIITSIGTLRTPEFAINEVIPFVNDDRFELHLYGTADERTLGALNRFLEERSVTNVFYNGRFEDGELPTIIERSDALLVYFLSKLDGLYHMPDRLYLGLQYAKPMIANADTYCAKYIVDNELGCAIDPNNVDLNKVYEYLSSADYDRIYRNAKRCLEEARADNEVWRKSIRNFIKS